MKSHVLNISKMVTFLWLLFRTVANEKDRISNPGRAFAAAFFCSVVPPPPPPSVSQSFFLPLDVIDK